MDKRNEFFDRVLGEIAVASIRHKPLSAEYLTPETMGYYPRKLYKFRSLNPDNDNRDYTLSMLREEYIWASHPERFTDITDSIINLSSSETKNFERWLIQHYPEFQFYKLPPRGVMSGVKCGTTLQELIDWQNKHTGTNGRALVRELKELLKQVDIAESMKKSIISKFEKITMQDFSNELRMKVLAEQKRIVTSFRKASFIASVTTTYENTMMWENYADGFSGIVIEYTIPPYEKLSEDEKRTLLHLFKVQYRKIIPKVSLIPFMEDYFQKEYYKCDVDYSRAAVEVYKQVLFKESSYQGESEWRFVDCLPDNRIPFPYVSKVMAGCKCTEENLLELASLCADKGIDLFVQKDPELNREFRFEKYVSQ